MNNSAIDFSIKLWRGSSAPFAKGKSPHCLRCFTSLQDETLRAKGKNECKICAKGRQQWWYNTVATEEYREKQRASVREYQRLNSHKLKEKKKISTRKRQYGLTEEVFQSMKASQNNACAICETPFRRTPCIDHCHFTGMVRGLLCDHCNTSLGKFKDSVKILQSAITYLNKYA